MLLTFLIVYPTFLAILFAQLVGMIPINKITMSFNFSIIIYHILVYFNYKKWEKKYIKEKEEKTEEFKSKENTRYLNERYEIWKTLNYDSLKDLLNSPNHYMNKLKDEYIYEMKCFDLEEITNLKEVNCRC